MIFVCAAVIIVAFSATSSTFICGDQYYFDPVVQNCAPCTDICKNAGLQGTVSECRLMCPEYEQQGGEVEVPGSASGSGLSPGLQAVAIITPLATVLIAVPIIIIGILKRKELRRLCKFTDNEVGRADEMESLNGTPEEEQVVPHGSQDNADNTTVKVVAGSDHQIEDGVRNQEACPRIISPMVQVTDMSDTGPYKPTI